MSIYFRTGQRKTLADAADAVSSVLDATSDLPRSASDIFIVEDKIVQDEVG